MAALARKGHPRTAPSGPASPDASMRRRPGLLQRSGRRGAGFAGARFSSGHNVAPTPCAPACSSMRPRLATPPEPKDGAMATFGTGVGNLTDAPALRFTPNWHAVANFRLAVTPRVREGDAWKDGETSFLRVNVWRKQAENAAESLSKGSRVVVVGKLKSRSWETPDGDKRSVVEIDADELGPSLKWATAKPQRLSKDGDTGGQFNDEPPF